MKSCMLSDWLVVFVAWQISFYRSQMRTWIRHHIKAQLRDDGETQSALQDLLADVMKREKPRSLCLFRLIG